MLMSELAITGVGVTTPIGQGRANVERGLLRGVNAFRVMQRPGRQKGASAFLGAEIDSLQLPDEVPEKIRRSISWSAQVALATLAEAWSDAQLSKLEPERIGLIVGGTNLQQRELVAAHDAYRERFEFLRPSYGQLFMDTDISALCSEIFGIRGPVYTVGGASASGHLAIIQALHAVQTKQVDACIALGALMDLSYWECQGLRALGAMGSERFADQAEAACRPFDQLHDGFIFGENCGAVVIEPLAKSRSKPYAHVRGWSYHMDGHRGPDPSLEGEMAAINAALAMAGLETQNIDYVNSHGSGSVLGDRIELLALKRCGLAGARINATKSILGHGLSAAGAVEVAATLLQMTAGSLHPTLNLREPIDPSFLWVQNESCAHRILNALNLSFGFGGINSAICLSNIH
jgi:malonyl-ACP decarboxylase